MNSPYATSPPLAHLDLPAIREYTAGVEAAVRANRAREGRENHLDSLWCWSANTPTKRRRA